MSSIVKMNPAFYRSLLFLPFLLLHFSTSSFSSSSSPSSSQTRPKVELRGYVCIRGARYSTRPARYCLLRIAPSAYACIYSQLTNFCSVLVHNAIMFSSSVHNYLIRFCIYLLAVSAYCLVSKTGHVQRDIRQTKSRQIQSHEQTGQEIKELHLISFKRSKLGWRERILHIHVNVSES